MTFHDRRLNSVNFQAWKMKLLNSMTFQGFHDLRNLNNVLWPDMMSTHKVNTKDYSYRHAMDP